MATSRNLLSILAGCLLAVLAPATASAQTPTNDRPSPVQYASVSELNSILAQVRDVAQSIDGDLAKTRVDKWKADAATKREAQANVESIRRNVQSALPEIITQLNNTPEDLAASFKLYRNLDALYDVFGPVAESAGAFGSKDEFQNLSNDLNALQSARHALGDRMQNLAAAKESELTRLRNQVRSLQAATPPEPPKKVVVDDTEPQKKPAKKKSAKPKPAVPPAPSPADPQSAPQAK
jgi:predicted  nucleic acid-binding Zn-ribbon protein